MYTGSAAYIDILPSDWAAFVLQGGEQMARKIKTLLNGIMKKFCILRGYTGKTIFENNTNNTGKKAFEAVEEGLKDGNSA